MGKEQKINEAASMLKKQILSKSPRFRDKLPGQRELAAEFGLSQSAVRLAMLRLQNEGLISILPYKGATVTQTATGRSDTLHLAVCEDLPHQRDFWQRWCHLFEQETPGTLVHLRFFNSHTQLEHMVFDRNINQIIVRPENFRDTQLPLVPLSELLPDEILTHWKTDYLPDLPFPDWTVAFPYQLQIPAIVYDASKETPPPPESSISDYLHWARKHYGPRSLPMPNIGFLRDCCGLNSSTMLLPQNGGPGPELTAFLKILEEMALLDLIDVGLNVSQNAIPQLLQSNRIHCTELFSHCWNAGGLLANGRFRLAPLPQLHTQGVNVFLSQVVMAGHRAASPAEKAWFELLASERFLSSILRAGLGVSPYREIQLAAAADDRVPIGLNQVNSRVTATKFISAMDRNFDQVWNSVTAILRRPVIIPLLLGRINFEEARNRIVREHLLEDIDFTGILQPTATSTHLI